MPLVDIVVADELMDELPQILSLLRARGCAQRPAIDYPGTVVTLEIDSAPEGASRIEPIFQRTPEGVGVMSMGWQYGT